MAKRRKKNDIVEGMMPPITMAGGAIGASVLGGALHSKLPAGTTNPLTTTGSTFGRFVGPVSGISAMGITLKQMRKVKKKMKGGRRK